MNVLSEPRERPPSFRRILLAWVAWFVVSYAALAAVAFLVYIGLMVVWS